MAEAKDINKDLVSAANPPPVSSAFLSTASQDSLPSAGGQQVSSKSSKLASKMSFFNKNVASKLQPLPIYKPQNQPTANATFSPVTLLRIKRDLAEFYKENLQSIHVAPSEDGIQTVHALIVGPDDTPYAKGFFYFVIRFPHDYPLKPPAVKLMTTGNHTIRFNPNLYSCGRVCLSILGTWSGPPWSSALNLTTVLLSIQSLMNEDPYFNEPGYENYKEDASYRKASASFNESIVYQTLKVAVLGMLEETYGDTVGMPSVLKDLMKKHFRNNYGFYEKLALDKRQKMKEKEANKGKSAVKENGSAGNANKYSVMEVEYDFGGYSVHDHGASFQRSERYDSLLERLKQLKTKFDVDGSEELSRLKLVTNSDYRALAEQFPQTGDNEPILESKNLEEEIDEFNYYLNAESDYEDEEAEIDDDDNDNDDDESEHGCSAKKSACMARECGEESSCNNNNIQK